MTRGLILMLLFGACTGTTSDDATDDTTDDTEVDTDTDTDVDTDTDLDTDTDVDTDPQVNELPDDPCLDLGEPVLRLGIGEDSVVAADATTDAYMVHGGQGGWHINLSFEVENAPSVLRFDIRAYDTGGTEVGAYSSTSLMVPLDDTVDPFESCAGGQYGLAVAFEPETYNDSGGINAWEAFCGDEIRYEVDVSVPLDSATDVAHLISGEVRVRAQPDPCDCSPCNASGTPPTCNRTDPTHPSYDADDPYVIECLRPPDTGDTGDSGS